MTEVSSCVIQATCLPLVRPPVNATCPGHCGLPLPKRYSMQREARNESLQSRAKGLKDHKERVDKLKHVDCHFYETNVQMH